MKIITTILAVVLLLCTNMSFATDRCRDFIPDVRAAHIRYLGLQYPWWYGLGQLKQESGCRADVTAFDAGMGIAQFMPATAKEINRLMGANLNPYNPEHGIRMQAFYMSRLHKENDSGKAFITYMYYNSGPGTTDKEIKKSGSTDWDVMKTVCKRKVLTLKSGKKLDLCDVGYDYPKRIYKYGQIYKTGKDSLTYW